MPENRWELFPPKQVGFQTLARQNARPMPKRVPRERTCRKQKGYRNKATIGDSKPGRWCRAGLRLPNSLASLLQPLAPPWPERVEVGGRHRAALCGRRRLAAAPSRCRSRLENHSHRRLRGGSRWFSEANHSREPAEARG